MSTTASISAARYPQSHRLSGEIRPVIEALAANQRAYNSFYFDTVEGMSGSNFSESEDHHQGAGPFASAPRRVDTFLPDPLRG